MVFCNVSGEFRNMLYIVWEVSMQNSDTKPNVSGNFLLAARTCSHVVFHIVQAIYIVLVLCSVDTVPFKVLHV